MGIKRGISGKGLPNPHGRLQRDDVRAALYYQRERRRELNRFEDWVTTHDDVDVTTHDGTPVIARV